MISVMLMKTADEVCKQIQKYPNEWMEREKRKKNKQIMRKVSKKKRREKEIVGYRSYKFPRG